MLEMVKSVCCIVVVVEKRSTLMKGKGKVTVMIGEGSNWIV